MLRKLICFCWLLSSAPLLPAADPPGLPPPVLARLHSELQTLRWFGMAADKLEFSRAEDGTYRIVAGTFLFRINADGSASARDYLLAEEPYASLDEDGQARYRRAAIAALDQADMIVFAPPAGQSVRHTLTVFSDVTCPFSAALHRDIEFLNGEGVEIRYLGYPRYGLDSLGYKKMVPVWCSGERPQAFTDAISGKRIKLRYCQDHPLQAQYWLGESFGFPGTPAIILEDGKMLVGYDGDPAALLDYLEAQGAP